MILSLLRKRMCYMESTCCLEEKMEVVLCITGSNLCTKKPANYNNQKYRNIDGMFPATVLICVCFCRPDTCNQQLICHQ